MHDIPVAFTLAPVATIGENVRAVRLKAKLSQVKLAGRMNVAQTRISEWENDRYDTPDLSTLLALAKGLGCSIDDLIAGRDEEYDSLVRVRTAVGHKELGPELPSHGVPSDSWHAAEARVFEERTASLKTSLEDIIAIATLELAGARGDYLRPPSAPTPQANPGQRSGGRRQKSAS